MIQVITMNSAKDYKIRKFGSLHDLKKFLSHRGLFTKFHSRVEFKGQLWKSFTVMSREKDVTPQFKEVLVEL